MPLPTRPQDLYVQNGWYLEMPGLISPHFETLEGVQQSSGTVETTDAGTNKKVKFSSQITDYGEMTLTRPRQGTADDALVAAMVKESIERGVKISCSAVKLHKGQEAFRIAFTGFRFVNRQLPTFDVNSEEKFVETYAATCDDWTEL